MAGAPALRQTASYQFAADASPWVGSTASGASATTFAVACSDSINTALKAICPTICSFSTATNDVIKASADEGLQRAVPRCLAEGHLEDMPDSGDILGSFCADCDHKGERPFTGKAILL
jgi:hypothetical protein